MYYLEISNHIESLENIFFQIEQFIKESNY